MCDEGSTYTLHYFDARGRAEIIRYIFAYTKTAFEDHRIAFKDEWPEFKASKAPLGQLPLLECRTNEKSRMVCQSGTIIRTLAKCLEINGKTPAETARADEAYETLKDLWETSAKIGFEPDPKKKEQLVNQIKNEMGPSILAFLEKRVQENSTKNLAASDDHTYADLFVAQFFDEMSLVKVMDMGKMEKNYPGLFSLAKAINESPNVKEYLEKRPDTPF